MCARTLNKSTQKQTSLIRLAFRMSCAHATEKCLRTTNTFARHEPPQRADSPRLRRNGGDLCCFNRYSALSGHDTSTLYEEPRQSHGATSTRSRKIMSRNRLLALGRSRCKSNVAAIELWLSPSGLQRSTV